MIYDHEQSNPGLAFTLLAGAFGMLVVVLATGEPGPIFGSAFLGMIAFVGFAFSGLRTSVGPDTIELADPPPWPAGHTAFAAYDHSKEMR